MEPFGTDTELKNYMAYPRFLLDLELPETAKLVYAVLLDRARLSARNPEWRDERGQVYLYFTLEHLAQTLHRGKTTVKTALGLLEQNRLIIRRHQGMGKPSRIYVLVPETDCREGPKSGLHRDSFPAPNKRKERNYSFKEGESL